MFFSIESRNGSNRADDDLSGWIEYERHPVLWTARNRVRQMILETPRLQGRLRVVGVTPLDAVNKEFGS